MNSFETEMRAIKALYDSGEVQRKTRDFARELRRKPIVLYGAGTLSSFVISHLRTHDIEIECFCDTYRTGVHKETGFPIISAEQLTEKYPDATVIITSELHGVSILKTLRTIAYPGKIFSFDDLLGFYTVPYEDFAPHIDGYEWAYHNFKDEISRAIVLDAIRNRVLGLPMIPSANPQYFEPEIAPLSETEIFVDGGCFIGDTAEEFIRRTNGRYRRIYGFEPDEGNWKKARANLAPYANVEVLCGGLYHMTNTYRFKSGADGGSRLSEEGDVFANTFGLDEYFYDKEPPTFIKMDIEGSEYLALDGAATILRNHKPKLAICVYHQLRDMYVLPQHILDINPDYTLRLRHYSRWYAESVCFAT